MLVAGITRGLQAHDIEHMTLGMWVDYIIEWNEMHEEARKDMPDNGKKPQNKNKKATQVDFDAFFGKR